MNDITTKGLSEDTKLLLSIKESAEQLGMGETWMKTQTEIPYVRIGRRKLFKPADLRTFVENNVRGLRAK